jgi:NADH-quinone oxidoreductase subunit H
LGRTAAAAAVDTIKLLTKEDLLPGHVNSSTISSRRYYRSQSADRYRCIPFGPKINIFGVETYMQLTDLNIGVLSCWLRRASASTA